MKIFISLILCFIATLSAFANETFSDNGFNFEIISENDKAVALIQWTETKYSGDITIPSTVSHNGSTYSVTKIEEYAFEDCSELTSINTGSVKNISSYAFKNCVNLQSIIITASVKTIADNAFTLPTKGITNLTFEDSPNSIQVGYRRDFDSRMPLFTLCDNPENNDACELYIGRNIIYDTKYFWGCFAGRIKNLTISENVTEIPKRMFDSCSFIDENYHIIMPNSILSIGEGAFANVNIYYVTLSQNLLTIGENAFYHCPLRTINIPNSVNSIGAYAFMNCKDLYDIYLGSNIQTIGSNGFSNCTSLNKVYSYSSTPPSINENVFSSSTYAVAELHTPKGTLNSYSTANGWKKFIDIFDDIDTSTGIDNTYEDNFASPIYYDLMGNKIEHPNTGIYIEVKGSKATKIYF